MLEGKLITIPALGHQNKGKSSFTGSVLFVLMSHYGNNNELALPRGGFCTTWSLVAKGLLKGSRPDYSNLSAVLQMSGRVSIQSRSQRLRSFWSAPSIRAFPVRWIRVTHALGTRVVSIFRCLRYLVFLSLVERFSQLAHICARIMLPSCVHSLLVPVSYTHLTLPTKLEV